VYGAVDKLKMFVFTLVLFRSRGFGFITFNTSDSANRALSNVPHIIDNRQVDPKRATSREVRSTVIC